MIAHKLVPAALAAVILLSGVAFVSAHQAQDEEDAQESAALQNAKVTLSEAIAAAEKEVPGGKVIDAEVDSKDGVASYFIEIEKDGVQTVRVDMQTGQASKVSAEADDADDRAAGAHREDEDEDEHEDEDDN